MKNVPMITLEHTDQVGTNDKHPSIRYKFRAECMNDVGNFLRKLGGCIESAIINRDEPFPDTDAEITTK